MSDPASLGPYQLSARLGVGGMAEVWKATAHGAGGFQRTVVVKRILPHLADEPRFVEMFLAEARLSALLHHANVVDVFACGEIEGRFYMAMEYVHGHDLHRLLSAHGAIGPPDPGLGAFVMREVCRALAHAHTLTDDACRPLGLVHRDVSLSNVMASYDGGVKLLDFGIARAFGALDERHARGGRLEGKRGYLAPEALEGRAVDARADQFSAGVVLHELLTGTRLYPHRDLAEPPRPVLPPSTLNPRVPTELDRICLRALAASRSQRYPSCEELAAELDEVVHRMGFGPRQLGELLERLLPADRLAPGAAPTSGTESMSADRSASQSPGGAIRLPSLAAPDPGTHSEAAGVRGLGPAPRTGATDTGALGNGEMPAPLPGARPRRRALLAIPALALAATVAVALGRSGPRVTDERFDPRAAPGGITEHPRPVAGPDAGATAPTGPVVTPLAAEAPGVVLPPPLPGAPPRRIHAPPPKNVRHAPEPNLRGGDVLNPFH